MIVSQARQSSCMIVKERDPSNFGIDKRFEPPNILAMIGIYVDDYLGVGQVETVEKFRHTFGDCGTLAIHNTSAMAMACHL